MGSRLVKQNTRQAVGSSGEQLAGEYLRAMGFSIEAHNVRTREGEIDLIARRDHRYHFIEVRAKRGIRFGSPADSITTGKLEKMMNIAEEYLVSRHLSEAAWQVDLVSIRIGADGNTEEISYLPNIQ